MLTNRVEGHGRRSRDLRSTTACRMSGDGVTNDASKFLFVHQSWSA
jgi:hypothetical protein